MQPYQLYTHVLECENELLQKPHDLDSYFTEFLNSMKEEEILSELEIQSNPVSSFLAQKFLPYLPGDSHEAKVMCFERCLHTAAWVLRRIQRINDWWDIHDILDYVSRIHSDKTIVEVVLACAFSEAQPQSMDWSVLKDITTGYEGIRKHPAVIKFMKVIALAFSGGMLKSLGIEAEGAKLWEMVSDCFTKILGHTDFIAACADLLHFVGERIAAFCTSGDWKSLLHTPRSYSKWADDAYDILEKSITLSNPEVINTDYHAFMGGLAKCISQGTEIKQYVRAAEEKDAVSQLLSRLRTLHNDLLIKNASGKFRMSPFSIMVSAGSSAGKSSFVDTLITHYGKLFSKPLEDEFIYTRTASEEHWNNFKTSMWACILDDIAFVNPNKGTEDPSLLDVLQIVNNVPFSPPQAALEDKGRTPFRCELVVATTNTEDLKAHNWFNNPQAIRRRLPYVVNIVPQDQYRIPGTLMLDPSKVSAPLTGHYPDLWTITVKKVKVNPQEQIEMDIILKTDSIYVFLQEYNSWIDQHRATQNSFMASKTASKEVALCPVHRLPTVVCDCVPLVPQGGEGYTWTEVAGMAGVAYLTYGMLNNTADCALETISRDPTVVERPHELIIGTAVQAAKRVQHAGHKAHAYIKGLTREAFKSMLKGALTSVYDAVSPYLAKLMKFLAFAVGAGLSYMFFKKHLPELFPQGDIHEVGEIPKKKGDEIENVWRKDDYDPSDFMSRLSGAWASEELPKVAGIVSRNVVWCNTTHGLTRTSHTRFRAMCIVDHLYVTSNHVLPKDEYFDLQVISTNPSTGCNGNVTFKVAQKCILRLPERDLAFFMIKHMPVRRDLREILPKRGLRFEGPGRMIMRNPDGSVDYINSVRSVLRTQEFLPQFSITNDICYSRVDRDTENGMCGSPMLVKQPNGVILGGIHDLGGGQHTALAATVFDEDVVNALEHFGVMGVNSDAPNLAGVELSQNISPKCAARFIEEGNLEVYGSFTGFKRQPKSSAVPTVMCAPLQALGHVLKHKPAPMRGYLSTHRALKDMTQKKYLIKEDVMQKCMTTFCDEIFRDLPQESKDELKSVLPLKVALNGAPGVRFLDSMNFKSSAGFPHNKSKKHFVIKVPGDDVWQQPVVLTREMEDEVQQVWDKMSSGTRCATVFMQHLKDEALPLTKEVARVFMGSSMAWSICVRMLFLPFVRVMQKHKYIFECAPGTNATSIEWTRLYQYLSAYGKNKAIAGDFKSFDKNMGSLVILLAFQLIVELCKRCGLDQQFLIMMWTVGEDVAFAFCNFNGDLVQFFGSNPSGHPLTVIINCIVNSLYMRYCYHELSPNKEVVTFKQNVRLITYGDDNGSTSKVDWFNHTAIAEVLAGIGIVYTMADKKAASVPFIPLKDVSFLKRTFVWDEQLQAHMARLEEDSIWKMLMICIPSGTEVHERQCISIVQSAVSEWFFYGKERFELEVAELKKVVQMANLNHYVDDKTFPTWETLVQRFRNASDSYLATEPCSTRKLLGEMTWSPLATAA